jgi:hypothetical protein
MMWKNTSKLLAGETMKKTLNMISDRSGQWVSVIRAPRVRRYKHLTPASLARCRCIVRNSLQSKTLPGLLTGKGQGA